MKLILFKIKSFFINVFEHPFVTKMSTAIVALFTLVFAIVMAGILTSSIYLPLRIYFTGTKFNDVVKSISCSTTLTRSGPIEICNIVGQTNYNYDVDPWESRQLKQGNIIRVFASKRLQRGVYLKNSTPTFS